MSSLRAWVVIVLVPFLAPCLIRFQVHRLFSQNTVLMTSNQRNQYPRRHGPSNQKPKRAYKQHFKE